MNSAVEQNFIGNHRIQIRCPVHLIQERIIGKNKNTFAKMQREKRKKFKAEEKRKRRLNRNTESLIKPEDVETAKDPDKPAIEARQPDDN